MKPEPKFDWSALDAALDQTDTTKGLPPQGAFSVNDFVSHRGVGIEAARRQIRRMEKEGLVKSAGFFLSRSKHRTQYWTYAKQSVR